MITLQLPAGQQRHQQPQEGVTISDGDWSPPRHRRPEYPAHIRRGFIRMLQPTIPAANIDHMNNGLTFHTHLCPLKGSLITIKPWLFYFLVIVLSLICKIVWQFRIAKNVYFEKTERWTQSTTVYLLISEAVRRSSSSYNHLACVGAH